MQKERKKRKKERTQPRCCPEPAAFRELCSFAKRHELYRFVFVGRVPRVAGNENRSFDCLKRPRPSRESQRTFFPIRNVRNLEIYKSHRETLKEFTESNVDVYIYTLNYCTHCTLVPMSKTMQRLGDSLGCAFSVC